MTDRRGLLLGLLAVPGLLAGAVGNALAADVGTVDAGTADTGEPVAVIVYAAASLTDVMTDLIPAFEAQARGGALQGVAIRLALAGSSILARQIEAGGHADIMVSANEQWMDYLAQRQLIDPASRVDVAGNQLVLVAPASAGAAREAPVTLDADTDLMEILGPKGRLALGDPAHVPAGIYARQALDKLGLWQGLQPHLALVENVRGALALVARGEAPLGIVYATDADQPAGPTGIIRRSGVSVLATVPDRLHDPIRYPAALVRPQGEDDGAEAATRRRLATAFLAFMTGPEGQAIFRRHGFVPLRPAE